MKSGFSLIEILIAVAIFAFIATATYQGFAQIIKGTNLNKLKITALNLANEQLEIVRNLQYSDVGIINGLPAGKIPHEQVLIRDGITFNVTTTIRDIDDPFDGTIGGTPNDLSPADNKTAEVEISCGPACIMPPFTLTSRIAPKGLETTGNNGALFIQVFNANGSPLPNANVHIENASSTIVIDDVTNNSGLLQIVNAPPGTGAYKITVTKSGYSTEKTYTIGDPANPVPSKPHANVVTGQVTQVSFSIDELSDITVSAKRTTCAPVGGINFQLTGAKVIGLDTFKYNKSHTVNGSGNISIDDIEWDTYTVKLNGSSYDLAGSNTILPLNVNPGADQHIDLIVEPHDPNALLVQVKDAATGLPLSGAEVSLTGNGTTTTLMTGRGFLRQTDWSGGGGQDDIGSINKYFSSDGQVSTTNPAGDITLAEFAGSYFSTGNLTSSTFDTGTSSNFYTIEWIPSGQPAATGNDSVRFQVATNAENTATTTWDFVGPTGAGSYFTSPTQAFSSSHNGDRYLKYKAFLSTASATTTPQVSDVSFTFSSDCLPSGQVFFQDLNNGNYTLHVEKNGYQDFDENNVSISSDWKQVEVILTP